MDTANYYRKEPGREGVNPFDIFRTFANMKAKSTYRFTSLKEPSLRELRMIMQEVAVEAKEKSEIAKQEFFRKIAEQLKKESC